MENKTNNEATLASRIAELQKQLEAKEKVYAVIVETDEQEAVAYAEKMVNPLKKQISDLKFSAISEEVTSQFNTSAANAAPSLVKKAMLTGRESLVVQMVFGADGTVTTTCKKVTPSNGTTQTAGDGTRKKRKAVVSVNGVTYPTAAEAARAFFAIEPNHPKAGNVGKTGINWLLQMEGIAKTHPNIVSVTFEEEAVSEATTEPTAVVA